jgi:hypothetical protein
MGPKPTQLALADAPSLDDGREEKAPNDFRSGAFAHFHFLIPISIGTRFNKYILVIMSG